MPETLEQGTIQCILDTSGKYTQTSYTQIDTLCGQTQSNMLTVLQLLMLKGDAQDSKVLVPLSLQGLQILRQKADSDNSLSRRKATCSGNIGFNGKL